MTIVDFFAAIPTPNYTGTIIYAILAALLLFGVMGYLIIGVLSKDNAAWVNSVPRTILGPVYDLQGINPPMYF